MKEPVDWFSEGSDKKSYPALGPRRNSGILSLEKKEKKEKNLLSRSGYVTFLFSFFSSKYSCTLVETL
jgi:hypothetical protein